MKRVFKSLMWSSVALTISVSGASKDSPPGAPGTSGQAQPPATVQKDRYLIMAPPWAKLKHADAKQKLHKWGEDKNEWGAGDNPSRDMREVNHSTSGGHAFIADISKANVATLAQDLQFFVSPLSTVEADPIIDEPYSATGAEHVNFTAKTIWAAGACVPTVLTNKTALRTPVLYVVDSGVQPLVIQSGTTYEWHPQFTSNTTASSTIRFRQGRTSSLIGQWPPSDQSPWNDVVDTPFMDNPSLPYNNTNPGVIFDPQKDPIAHGTKVASTAIGCVANGSQSAPVSTFGRIQGLTVEVESIRVYGTSSTTDTAVVVDGIYEAIDAHLQRVSDNNNQPVASVLLLASRTSATAPSGTRFDVNFEAALWWAWYNGMIVVASGGNEGTTPYDTTSKRLAPDPMWFPLPASQPSSPSRYDWTQANLHPAAWPNLATPDGTPIPAPTLPYAILVGGDNSSYAAPGNTAWASSSSQGVGIDIVVPSLSVPCDNLAKTNYDSTGDYLEVATGTSLSAGYVAGAAVAYDAIQTTLPTPAIFRTWLLGNPGGAGSPTIMSTAPVFGVANAFVPMLRITDIPSN